MPTIDVLPYPTPAGTSLSAAEAVIKFGVAVAFDSDAPTYAPDNTNKPCGQAAKPSPNAGVR